VEDEAHKRARNVACARPHAEQFVPVVSPEAGASSAQPAAAAPLPACLANTASDHLQAIMQMLDSSSVLRLARCSRSLLHFALSRPTAWEGGGVLQLRIKDGMLLINDILPSVLSPLLRLLPMRLCINGSPASRPGALLTDARVTELRMHAMDRVRNEAPTIRFLEPFMSSLQVADLSMLAPQITRPLLPLLGAALQLRSLRIRLHSDAAPDSLGPLVALPNLKHVGLWSFGIGRSYAPLLAPLLRCIRLSCLTLVRTELAPGELRAFLAQVGRSCAALKTLILEDLCQAENIGSLTVAEFVGAFSTLTRLRALMLDECVAQGIVPELRQLSQQHALRQLCLIRQGNYEMTSLMVHDLFRQLPAPLCLRITDTRKTDELQQLAREEPRFTAGVTRSCCCFDNADPKCSDLTGTHTQGA